MNSRVNPLNVNFNRTAWPLGPKRPILVSGDIHIWIGDYRLNSARLLEPLLSQSELERAGRFHKPVDRDHYIIRRAGLRRILGRYLNLDPQAIEFENGPYGKPMLSPRRHPELIHFNVSTSRDHCIYAVACKALGVDLEFIDPFVDIDMLAANVLSPEESVVFASCPKPERPSLFFGFWTAKEACVKCCGQGLGLDLKRVEIGSPDCNDRFKATGVAGAWSLIRLTPAEGYTAVVAGGEEMSNIATFTLDG